MECCGVDRLEVGHGSKKSKRGQQPRAPGSWALRSDVAVSGVHDHACTGLGLYYMFLYEFRSLRLPPAVSSPSWTVLDS